MALGNEIGISSRFGFSKNSRKLVTNTALASGA